MKTSRRSSASELVSRVDAELWSTVHRIARCIPKDVDPWAFDSEIDLIDALGKRGAFDALRAIQSACRRYYIDVLFALLKIASPPRWSTDERREPALDWSTIYRVPWRADSLEESGATHGQTGGAAAPDPSAPGAGDRGSGQGQEL